MCLAQQTAPRYRFLVSHASQIALRPDVAAGPPFPQRRDHVGDRFRDGDQHNSSCWIVLDRRLLRSWTPHTVSDSGPPDLPDSDTLHTPLLLFVINQSTTLPRPSLQLRVVIIQVPELPVLSHHLHRACSTYRRSCSSATSNDVAREVFYICGMTVPTRQRARHRISNRPL
jgi:hypothetical protein